MTDISQKIVPVVGDIPPRQPSGVDLFRLDLQKEQQKAIDNFFRGDKEKVMKFMSSVVHSVKKTPKLLECEKVSLMNAFMACAEYELYPSSVSGEAYVLPYTNKGQLEAQFQLGYQGVITLLYRAGMKNITSEIVYANDVFEYEAGLTPKLVHKPKVFGDKGEAIGLYAIATLNGGEKQFKVLSKEDVMKFKEFSKSKNSDFSPWNPKNDPELSMWKKTAVKQLAKFLPKNSTIYEAFEKDNRDSRISEVKALTENSGLRMGNLLKQDDDNNQEIAAEKAVEIEKIDAPDNNEEA